MIHTSYQFNSVRQTASAFKSLSFKGKKGYSQPYIFKEMTRSQGEPYTHTKCGRTIIQEYKQSPEPELNDLLKRDKPLPRARIYGAIVRCKTEMRTSYIVVQGRYTGKWTFPKGHMKKNELHYDCAVRELKEETGIKREMEHGSNERVGYGMYYILEVDQELSLNTVDNKEIMNTRWVTLEEMKELSMNSDASAFMRLMSDKKK